MAAARDLANGAAKVAVGAAKVAYIGAWGCTVFLVLGLFGEMCAGLVWWIDCHQGTARQRRLVRANYQVYKERLAPNFTMAIVMALILLAVFCGIYGSAVKEATRQ